MIKDLLYTVDVKLLKKRGYVFHKLYARNYKCYNKRFGSGWDIWVWVKGKDVYVKDWGNCTYSIIKYWKENRARFEEKNKGRTSVFGGPITSMWLEFNSETGEVRERDLMKHFENMQKGIYDDNWRELGLTTDRFEEIVKEIEFLIGKKIK